MEHNETKAQNQGVRTNDSSKVKKCFNCGTNSNQRLLLSCTHKDEDVNVCARCLPMFIHGGGE